jgi:hypothetical protein
MLPLNCFIAQVTFFHSMPRHNSSSDVSRPLRSSAHPGANRAFENPWVPLKDMKTKKANKKQQRTFDLASFKAFPLFTPPPRYVPLPNLVQAKFSRNQLLVETYTSVPTNTFAFGALGNISGVQQ